MNRPGLIGILLGLGFAAAPAPAGALVPYVYMPSSAELQTAGEGIGEDATQLLQTGRVEQAEQLAMLAVLLLPEDPRSWLLLAEARLRNDDRSGTREALARARTLEPSNAGVWFAEGSLALRDEEYGAAERLIREGLALDPENANAHFDLGNTLLKLEQPLAALDAFEKATAIRDNFWEAVNNQGLVLFELGRVLLAQQRWQEAITLSNEAAEPMLALGASRYGQGIRDRETIQLVMRALVKDPAYAAEAHQEDQLWGEKLRAAARALFQDAQLKPAVKRALILSGQDD